MAWGQLLLNAHGRDAEGRAEPVAEWLAHHGHELGARTPNVAERGRAAGEVHRGLRASTATARAAAEGVSPIRPLAQAGPSGSA